MKNGVLLKILSLAVVLSLTVSIFTGCEGKKSKKYNDGVNGLKISIENDANKDKVITEKKFKKPELKENSGTFTMSAFFSSKMILQANMAGRIWGNYWGYEDAPWIALEIKNSAGKKQTYYGQADKKE